MVVSGLPMLFKDVIATAVVLGLGVFFTREQLGGAMVYELLKMMPALLLVIIVYIAARIKNQSSS